eukprot:CAMPEP_0172533232 /NCGR_PEP_ID=MMETSP1067-20121228/6014_1 /TAXON_ID=265564 ORGANISM="Thalassiosira punctigera, Strain Tpunct2005C2" /NCGR_SAMPLE_ID=MMETSP1067 /ASSEMBLY_ACC=CAM_ASM_000444 /LENGTH=44 /DNA_ID= /DNA_START= /DNA_END= /DNA_ORIENTATION=
MGRVVMDSWETGTRPVLEFGAQLQEMVPGQVDAEGIAIADPISV